LLAVLAILALASYFRVRHLGDASLWLDEILNVDLTVQPRALGTWLTGFEPENGPLYYLAQRSTLHCCRSIEAAFRVPAVVAGVLSVAAMFFVGYWAHGVAAGVLASLLLAISPIHVYDSREGRPYALLVLATLLLLLFLLRIGSAGSVVGASLTILASAYIAATATPLILSAGLVAAIQMIRLAGTAQAGRWRAILISAVVGILLVAMLYARFDRSQPALGFSFEPLRLAHAAAVAFSSSALQAGLGATVPILVLLLVLLGTRRLIRQSREKAIPVIGLTILPPTVALVALWLGDHWFSVRYILVSLPGFLVLAAVGAATVCSMVSRGLSRWPRLPGLLQQGAGLGVVILMMGLIVPANMRAALAEPLRKGNWRAIASSLWFHASDGDVVIAENAWSAVCLRFYLRGFPDRLRVIDAGESLPRAEAIVADHGRVWMVSAGFARDHSLRRWMCQFFLVDRDPADSIAVYYAPSQYAFLKERATAKELERWRETFFEVRQGRLTMGREDDSFFGDGWHGPELNEADPFRWATARAELLVPGHEDSSELHFRSAPASLRDGRSQRMEIRWNGETLAEVLMPPEAIEYRVPLPPSRSSNLLEFLFAATARPSDWGPTEDRRELAASFDWIEIISANASPDSPRWPRRLTLFRPDRLTGSGPASTLVPPWPPPAPEQEPPLDAEEIAALLKRLGFNPEMELPRILRLKVPLGSALEQAMAQLDCLDDGQFVDAAYLLLFHRYPDVTGRRFYLKRLHEGTPRARVLRMLLRSMDGTGAS
jgi:hypothetical protein